MRSVPLGNMNRNPETQARSDLAYALLGASNGMSREPRWGMHLLRNTGVELYLTMAVVVMNKLVAIFYIY